VLKAPYYNADIFKVLRAAYNRTIYQRGDRRNKIVRRYCEWLEKNVPHIYNRENLVTNKSLASQIENENNSSDKQMDEEVKDKPRFKEEHDSDSSDSCLSTPKKKVLKGLPGGIKASTRTNLRKSASNQIPNGPDEKHRPAGVSSAKSKTPVVVRSEYKPPASRIRPLPNVITKPEPPPPPPVVIKPPKQRILKLKVKAAIPQTDKSAAVIAASALNQPAPIRTYGSKTKVVTALETGSGSVIGDLLSSSTLSATLNTPTQITVMETPILTTPTFVSVPPTYTTVTTTMSSIPPKQVLLSGRNLTRGLMVHQPVTQGMLNQNQKSTPILIRSLTPNQVQQHQNQQHGGTTTVIQTSTGGITIPTSGMQFHVGPAGSTGQGFALVNIRGGLPGTVIRTSNIGNIGNIAQGLTLNGTTSSFGSSKCSSPRNN
jgi:hypothetical protein